MNLRELIEQQQEKEHTAVFERKLAQQSSNIIGGLHIQWWHKITFSCLTFSLSVVKINQCLIFTSLRDRGGNVIVSFLGYFWPQRNLKKPVMLKVQSGSLKEKQKYINSVQKAHLKRKF